MSATAVSSSQINLSWTDSDSTEAGFKIERCSGAGCSDFAQIATVGTNVTSYSNTGLTALTSYSYRVRAYNTAGDSDYSNTASAVTLEAPALPLAPSNLVASAFSKSQINLTWTDNSGNETGFRIERCKGSTCTNFALIATVGANVTSYSNTKLNCKHNLSLPRLRLQCERQFGLLEHRCGDDTETLISKLSLIARIPYSGSWLFNA